MFLLICYSRDHVQAHDRIKDIESAAGRLASAGRLADSELLFDKARSIRLEMETFLEENRWVSQLLGWRQKVLCRSPNSIPPCRVPCVVLEWDLRKMQSSIPSVTGE